MTHTLPQTALAALAAAGCDVPKLEIHGNSQPFVEYGQPTESAVMDFIAAKTGHVVALERLFGYSDQSQGFSDRPEWEASGAEAGEEPYSTLATGGSALLALYALALAVGAVKEGTE